MPQYERLIANNDLYNPGEYGRARAGQEFMCPSNIAQRLVKQGSARRVIYETKVVYPEAPEVAHGDPFRYLPVFDQEPPAMAPEGHPVFSDPDVQEPGNADRGKRGGRKKADSE